MRLVTRVLSSLVVCTLAGCAADEDDDGNWWESSLLQLGGDAVPDEAMEDRWIVEFPRMPYGAPSTATVVFHNASSFEPVEIAPLAITPPFSTDHSGPLPIFPEEDRSIGLRLDATLADHELDVPIVTATGTAWLRLRGGFLPPQLDCGASTVDMGRVTGSATYTFRCRNETSLSFDMEPTFECWEGCDYDVSMRTRRADAHEVWTMDLTLVEPAPGYACSCAISFAARVPPVALDQATLVWR